MRNIKTMLLLAISVLILAACQEHTAIDNTISDTQRSEEVKTEVVELELELEPTEQDEDTAYQEYLTSLQYLDDFDVKISEALTTYDMRLVINESLEAWDKELNSIYKRLIDNLPAEQAEKLRVTQRLWITDRDQLAANNADEFEGGTLYQVAYNDTLLQCTKQRTLELAAVYYNKSNDFSYTIKLGQES